VRSRTHLWLLCLLVIAGGLWPYWKWGWWIEDAGISFAYARNLAEGHGLVAFPGGERVEGYSNPLWVVLLALWEVAGVDGFQSSRWMSIPFAASAVALVYRIGGRLRPDRQGVGLLAAAILASDCIFGIWSASGLENPLFCALLALAMWRTLVEGEDGGFPWAAVVFLLLALTRPEGIAYAAFGGFWALLIDRAEGRSWWRTVSWFAVFWVPFGCYHGVRYSYFALPFPATYYAKMGDVEFQPYAWNARSWMYLRRYCADVGVGWLLPLFWIGVAGCRGPRALLASGCVLATTVVLLIPGPTAVVDSLAWWPQVADTPELRQVRFWVLLGTVVSLWMALIRRPAWRVIGLSWGLLLIGVGFSIRSGGDWMAGFRFLSLVSVPQAVLLASGLLTVGDALRNFRGRRHWGWPAKAVVAALLLTWVIPHVRYFQTYVPPVTPFGVKKRLDHYRWAAARLQMLDRPVVVDHDLGGMMWFGPNFGTIIDARGLVDIPFAMHQKRRPFTKEYLLEQNPFDFCHAHASTGQITRQLPGFRAQYVEFPGFPSGKGLHIGNFVHKSHLVSEVWSGPERTVAFEGGIRVEGFRIVSPEVASDSGLYVEIGLSAPREAEGARVFAFIDGPSGTLQVWDVPPGYDDWYPIRDWRSGEIFHGRFSFPLRGDLPEGSYSLGFAAMGPDGQALGRPGGTDLQPSPTPVFLAGEQRFADQVEIVSRDDMVRLAEDDLTRAIASARADRCEQAELDWELAVRHLTRNGPWRSRQRDRVGRTLANCWSRTAVDQVTPRAQAAQMRRARGWDHTAGGVRIHGAAIADALWPLAMAARQSEDHEAAFELFDCVVAADPTRSWARRYAEEARGLRLGWVAGTRSDLPTSEEEPKP
jgi:hypothetical protein